MRLYFITSVLLLAGCQSPQSGRNNSVSGNDSVIMPLDVVKNADVHEQESPAVVMARAYLQNKFNKEITAQLIDSNSRRFSIAEYDLNEDGKSEIFIALNGMYFCGSGGCTILLLHSDGRLVNQFTVSEIPVLISAERSKVWNNLAITSKGVYHLMKFDGKRYPSNPSTQAEIKSPIDGEKVLEQQDRTKWFTF